MFATRNSKKLRFTANSFKHSYHWENSESLTSAQIFHLSLERSNFDQYSEFPEPSAENKFPRKSTYVWNGGKLCN